MKKGIGQVKEFLLSRGIIAQIVELGASTRNSQLAAKALGCTVGEIAKSVVFTGPRTMVVVLSGVKRVNLEKLSLVAGSKLRIASAEEVKTLILFNWATVSSAATRYLTLTPAIEKALEGVLMMTKC